MLVRDTLAKAGFVAHPSKSIWQPTQRLTWLGFVVDVGRLKFLRKKLWPCALCSGKLGDLRSTQIRVKALASVVWKIIAMGLAIGPVSRFRTRSLYAVLQSRNAWCDMLTLSPEAMDELTFWSLTLDDYNAQPIWHHPSAVRVVYSDASDTGCGGYVVEHGSCVSHGQWTADEAERSSTWRELSAVWLVLLSSLLNCRVRWFTDNQNVVRILEVGSIGSRICRL